MDTITIEPDSCVFLGAGDKSMACVSLEPRPPFNPPRGKGGVVGGGKVQMEPSKIRAGDRRKGRSGEYSSLVPRPCGSFLTTNHLAYLVHLQFVGMQL